MEEVKYNNGIVNEMIDDKVYQLLPSVLKNLTDNFEERERDIVLTSSLTALSVCLPNIFGQYDIGLLFLGICLVILLFLIADNKKDVINSIKDRILKIGKGIGRKNK